MTSRFKGIAACAMVVAIVIAGCQTTGDQMQTTVYDMHRRVVKLDRELESSVARLNESTATLLARVDESDQQTRTLRGLMEENQVKLDAVAQELNSMKTTLYRHWNLTTSGSGAPAMPRDAATGPVTIEGAPTAPPMQTTPPQHELLDSAPRPTDQFTQTPTAPALPVPEQTPVMTGEPALAPAPAAAPAGDAADPRVLYQQAQRSYANEDYATALQQFDAYLGQFPNNDLSANAQFWKAKCLLSVEKYAEAVQAFEVLRGNFSTSTKVPFAMHNQAVAHSRLGQTAQAERLMEAVIEQYPVSPAADQARADLRKLRGE